MKKIQIIGAPLDMGADRRGVDMGPDAMRNDGLVKTIEALGLTVKDGGDIQVPPRPQKPAGNPKLKYFEEITEACRKLRDSVSEAIKDGFFPVIIGGDHSITIGTAAGLSRHYARAGVLWIDAHGDFNTEETTLSGNIHGMSLAALNGIGCDPLVNSMSVKTSFSPANTVIVGVRDLDPREKDNLKKANVSVFTMRDIDEKGMCAVMREALSRVSDGTEAVHVSFDLDSLDPRDAPGVGTPVKGGISYREAHLIMEMVSECKKLKSLEVVELNPILDRHNETGRMAIELIASALGKKIYL